MTNVDQNREESSPSGTPTQREREAAKGQERGGLKVGESFKVDADFEQQKRAFLNIPPSDLDRYAGQFVVSRDGQIVDHDEDLSQLTNRFFRSSKDSPVYITRIGEPLRIVLRNPLGSRR